MLPGRRRQDGGDEGQDGSPLAVKGCAEAVPVGEGGTEAAGARRQDVSRSLSRRGGALRRRGGASALGGSGKRRDRAWRSGAVGDATAAMHVVKRGEGTPGGPRAAGSVGGLPVMGLGWGTGPLCFGGSSWRLVWENKTPLFWGSPLMLSGTLGGPSRGPGVRGQDSFVLGGGLLMALV